MGDQRVAFIVANADYPNNERLKLKAPRRDADALRHLLVTKAGFQPEDVQVCLDGDRRQLLHKLEAWKQEVQGSSLALFFYAGHGLQYNEEPIMMGSQWSGGRSHVDVEADGVGMHWVQKALHGSEKALILIDACRTRVASQGPFDNNVGVLNAAEMQNWLTRGPPSSVPDRQAQQSITYPLMALACLSGNAAVEQNDQGLFTNALMENLFNEEQTVIQALSNAADAVQEYTNGHQCPAMQTSSIHPDFAKYSLVPRVINLTYFSDWKPPYIYYKVGDGPQAAWRNRPLIKIKKQDQKDTKTDGQEGKKEWIISIEGNHIEFAMHNGKGSWDNKDAKPGHNYFIDTPGSHTLENGVIKMLPEQQRHREEMEAPSSSSKASTAK